MESRLEKISKKYELLCGRNASQLRLRLPSQEIWRFFIDGKAHATGRGLQRTQKFQAPFSLASIFSKNPLSYTVFEYMRHIEKIDPKQTDAFAQSSLLQLLQRAEWYLTDDQKDKLTLGDILKLDMAWIPYEINEPGYLKAMYTGFNIIFENSFTLSVSTIKNLHAVATRNVSNLVCKPEDAGSFRSARIGSYELSEENVTVDGIYELILQCKQASNGPYAEDICLFKCFGGGNGIIINAKFIQALEKTQQVFSDIEDVFLPFITSNSAILKQAYVEEVKLLVQQFISVNNDPLSMARIIYQDLSLQSPFFWYNQESRQHSHTQKELDVYIDTLITKYNSSLTNAKTNLDKLSAITRFIQSCEQLHPFSDGNCRTFCMLLLNALLIQNNFPLAILNDPNIFDMHSQHEIIQAVIAGMENTFTLISSEKIFNISTRQVIDNLKAVPCMIDKLNYFFEATNSEEIARLLHKPRLQ